MSNYLVIYYVTSEKMVLL
ncbi:hypothetical protein ACHAW6_008416 [Cyclotella cf. meneghiniana]